MMGKHAISAAIICFLWGFPASAGPGDGGFEAARQECAALTDFDELKRCVERVNGLTGGSPASALPPHMLALIESCQKSDSTSHLQDCVRKLTLVIRAQESARVAMAKAVTECSKEADDNLRRCLEELATIGAIPEEMAKRPASATPTPKQKGWHIAPQTESKIDGARRVLVLLLADEPISTSAGREAWPSIAIRCHENVTSVVVSAPGNFVTGGVAVAYKLDKDKPVSQTWMAADSRDAMGLWNGGQAIPFVKQLLEKSEMVFRFKPYRGANIETSFTVAGLDKVIEPIRSACKW